MAKQVGVSPATVERNWSGPGLKPHLVKTFKLSNDPAFEEKLIGVVGHYLSPPENAVVLCMDEKTSIQALDRTQPSLPMTKGRRARPPATAEGAARPHCSPPWTCSPGP